MALEPAEGEDLGLLEEGVEDREEPTATFAPSTETVKLWPVERAAELVGDVVAIDGARAAEDGIAAADGAAGAPPCPTGASTVAPSMIIDTMRASHTALLRGDMGRRCTPLYHLKAWNWF